MLDSMRKASSGWVAKFLLSLLVLSFGVWGVSSSMMSGTGPRSVIEVGDATVSPVEFRLAYDRQLRAMSQQFGTKLTREQAASLGIDQQVLSQLSAGALLDNLAKDMNLGISKDQLAILTSKDPSFFNASKQFDRGMFERVLREVGMRPEDYLQNRSQVARRQQIVDSSTDSMTAPAVYLDALSVYNGETRDVSYLVLPRRLIEPVPAPDAAKLQAFFDENKADYRFPEYRAIRYVKLAPEDMAGSMTVADADVRADYDKNLVRFTTPEQRTIEQLLFPDRAAADDALASLGTSKTFDTLIADQKKTAADVTLGTFEKAAVSDKKIGEAAFAITVAGGVSPVIDGAFGPLIVRVSAITPAVTKGFDEVKDAIRKELAISKAAESILDVHDAYEDARAGGDTMQGAAQKLNLKLVEIASVSRTGEAPDGKRIETLPEADQLLKLSFDSEVDAELPPISIGATGFLWTEVASVTPSRDAKLDEVKPRVSTDWTGAEADRLIAEKANGLLTELKAGKSLTEIATGLSLAVETAPGLSRTNQNATLGEAGVQAAFGGPQGHKAVVSSGADGAQILINVDTVSRPEADAGRVKDELEQLNVAVSNDLLDQLIGRLRVDTPVKVNQTAIDQALNF
jgi:peptidyl-prolyl cis-trans isomerase D